MYMKKKADMSLGELFAELSHEVLSLVRQEVEFAKVEMSEKTSRAAKDGAFLAVGGFVAFAGLLSVIASGIIALSRILPLWLSALSTGFLVFAAGCLLIWIGKGRLEREDPLPRRTVETVKEDAQWMENRME